MRHGAGVRRAAASGVLAAAVGLLASAPSTHPFDSNIGSAAIDRAVAIGRSSGAVRQRFHDQYVVRLGDPILEQLEIVTEFRRVVLATEDHVRLADAAWGARQAEEMLRSRRGTISLVLRVAFSPRNVYREMPRFALVLYARPEARPPGRLEPLDLIETPRYVSGQPAPPGTPILGGMVEAIFDARALDPRGVYLAGIALEGRELRRVELDFGRVQ